VILQRVFAVLAAILFVGSAALATLGPWAASLGRSLAGLQPDLPDRLHGWTERNIGAWVWSDLIQPILQRPVWLVPVAVGLVCLGLAVSLAGRNAARRSHRRRS
jgi:hypothetical protein